MVLVKRVIDQNNTMLIGQNCPGVITVDECKLGLKKLNQTLSKSISMNEITVELLENIKSDKTLYNRLYHVASENQRVLLMKGCFEISCLRMYY